MIGPMSTIISADLQLDPTPLTSRLLHMVKTALAIGLLNVGRLQCMCATILNSQHVPFSDPIRARMVIVLHKGHLRVETLLACAAVIGPHTVPNLSNNVLHIGQDF